MEIRRARGNVVRRLEPGVLLDDHAYFELSVGQPMVEANEFGLSVTYGRKLYRPNLFITVEIDESYLVRWLEADARAALEPGTIFEIVKRLPYLTAEEGMGSGLYVVPEDVPVGKCGLAWYHSFRMSHDVPHGFYLTGRSVLVGRYVS